jgi:hypothetical protein
MRPAVRTVGSRRPRWQEAAREGPRNGAAGRHAERVIVMQRLALRSCMRRRPVMLETR